MGNDVEAGWQSDATDRERNERSSSPYPILNLESYIAHVFPRRRHASRYRQMLLRGRPVRSLATVGIVAIAGGCGDGDASVFDGAQISVSESTVALLDGEPASAPSTALPTDSAIAEPPATTVASSPTTAPIESTTTTTSDVIPTAAFPDGGELLVDFTFAPTSSGERIHNPYIAVWIADLDGELVDTVSLWYQTGGRGTRWLRTLREWSDLTGEIVDATSSGATRPAGTYSVAWDGLDADGQPIAPGAYQLFVEAAREDGPYELSSAIVDFDGTEFAVALPDDGELLNLSARLVA